MTVDLPVEKPMTLARERFERIYKTIRDRICLLEYEPGARLGEEELAREFGVRLWLDGAAEAHQILPAIRESGVRCRS